MKGGDAVAIRILSVVPASPAARSGIRPEESVARINGEPVLDEIDFQSLTAASRLRITIENASGEAREVLIRKKEWEPLGLCLDETILMKPRHCRNHCLFCFVDQLPKGMRPTLYVKDDDWRLSLMMGNYVTLTNVDEVEFERMLRREASPLYISVHATDPEVRVRMLRNPTAGSLMARLTRMKEHGLKFHGQVVLCPGINDGAVLDQTLRDLISLRPAACSLAIVPLGMTGHREKLPCLTPFTPESAAALLDQVRPVQERCLREFGTRFVFPSDEFYCLSGCPIPSDTEYEDYVQIENGVGMLRQLEREIREAAEDDTGAILTAPDPYSPEGGFGGKQYSPGPEDAGRPESAVPGRMDSTIPTGQLPRRRLLIPTGTSARPFIEALAKRYAPPDTAVEVIAVKNRFFGESITVTGLIVGRDLIDTLRGKACDEILLCATMLRENTDRFLDDMTLEEVRQQLGVPLRVVENTGEALYQALRGNHGAPAGSP